MRQPAFIQHVKLLHTHAEFTHAMHYIVVGEPRVDLANLLGFALQIVQYVDFQLDFSVYVVPIAVVNSSIQYMSTTGTGCANKHRDLLDDFVFVGA